MAELPKFKRRVVAEAGSAANVRRVAEGFQSTARAIEKFGLERQERLERQELGKLNSELTTIATDFMLEKDKLSQEDDVDGVNPMQRYNEFTSQRLEEFRGKLTPKQDQMLNERINSLSNRSRLAEAEIQSKYVSRQVSQIGDEYDRNTAIAIRSGATLDDLEFSTSDSIDNYMQYDIDEGSATTLAQKHFSRGAVLYAEEKTRTPEGNLELVKQFYDDKEFDERLKRGLIDADDYAKIREHVDLADKNAISFIETNLTNAQSVKDIPNIEEMIRITDSYGVLNRRPSETIELQKKYLSTKKDLIEAEVDYKNTLAVREYVAAGQFQAAADAAFQSDVNGGTKGAEAFGEAVDKAASDILADPRIDNSERMSELVYLHANAMSAGIVSKKSEDYISRAILSAQPEIGLMGIDAISNALNRNSGLSIKDIFKEGSQARKLYEKFVSIAGVEDREASLLKARSLVDAAHNDQISKQQEKSIDERTQEFLIGNKFNMNHDDFIKDMAYYAEVDGFWSGAAFFTQSISRGIGRAIDSKAFADSEDVISGNLPFAQAAFMSDNGSNAITILTGQTGGGEKGIATAFQREFKNALRQDDSMSNEEAYAIAARNVSKVFGYTDVGGATRLARYPIERAIKAENRFIKNDSNARKESYAVLESVMNKALASKKIVGVTIDGEPIDKISPDITAKLVPVVSERLGVQQTPEQVHQSGYNYSLFYINEKGRHVKLKQRNEDGSLSDFTFNLREEYKTVQDADIIREGLVNEKLMKDIKKFGMKDQPEGI